jgi:thiosulfate/3-mercaptopyruvate sulfurtransferase
MDQTLISPEQLNTWMSNGEAIVVIDTRSPEEYVKGHIPGAVNIRDIFTYLANSDPEGIAAMQQMFAEAFGKAGLSGKERAVVYEDAMNTGYGQSCRGYYLLKMLGYPLASILHGGLRAWIGMGFALSADAATPQPVVFPFLADPSNVMVTKEEMLAALDDPAIVKLDVRDLEEWLGESSSPYGKDFCPRMGRLPGATWIEWYQMMDAEANPPLFRPGEAMRAAFENIGITPDSTVYVYCFKGARASNTYVALREAGVKNVKIYFGSWNEWSRDFSLPIEEGAPQSAQAA